MLAGKEILVTGGTGSLGRTIIKKLIQSYNPKGIRIFSRDEFKQWQMRDELEQFMASNNVYCPVSFLIGDVRDEKRIDMAMRGVDCVFNTAAMKQVPACEENPFEAVKTNIYGAQNIIEAAIYNNVEKVMHVSTDKCVYPVNLYGATKTVAEKMFIQGNVYTGGHGTRFSCCRYGNVIGSRGSIVPLFKDQAARGKITITDKRMTRFWITLDDVADFIIANLVGMCGGEIFVPKMPSVFITDVAQAIGPEAELVEIGIRHGEKLHECLITEEESVNTMDCGDHYIITKAIGERSDRWSYSSNDNVTWLNENKIKELVHVSN